MSGWKRRKRANTFMRLFHLVVISIFMPRKYFCCCCCCCLEFELSRAQPFLIRSLPMNGKTKQKEKKKEKTVGSRRVWYFCHTCWLYLWRHWYGLLCDKMAAPTVVFSRLLNVGFEETGSQLEWNVLSNVLATIVFIQFYSLCLCLCLCLIFHRF